MPGCANVPTKTFARGESRARDSTLGCSGGGGGLGGGGGGDGLPFGGDFGLGGGGRGPRGGGRGDVEVLTFCNSFRACNTCSGGGGDKDDTGGDGDDDAGNVTLHMIGRFGDPPKQLSRSHGR